MELQDAKFHTLSQFLSSCKETVSLSVNNFQESREKAERNMSGETIVVGAKAQKHLLHYYPSLFPLDRLDYPSFNDYL